MSDLGDYLAEICKPQWRDSAMEALRDTPLFQATDALDYETGIRKYMGRNPELTLKELSERLCLRMVSILGILKLDKRPLRDLVSFERGVGPFLVPRMGVDCVEMAKLAAAECKDMTLQQFADATRKTPDWICMAIGINSVKYKELKL